MIAPADGGREIFSSFPSIWSYVFEKHRQTLMWCYGGPTKAERAKFEL